MNKTFLFFFTRLSLKQFSRPFFPSRCWTLCFLQEPFELRRGGSAGRLALLGLCGQSMALIKGGAEHQLKSAGTDSLLAVEVGVGRRAGGRRWWGEEQFSHCIKCACVCVRASAYVLLPVMSY